MARIYLKTVWPCLLMLMLSMMPELAGPVWAQPGGMGGGGGPGGGEGPGRPAPPRFDLNKATTITGQIESLGSYGMTGWRAMPGMAVQGLVLKTGQGTIEVYLGPPSYVSKQKFTLQKGDTLEVRGFRVTKENRTAFLAAKVKKQGRTLTLLDEQGFPLWRQRGPGGPGPEGAGPGRMGSGGMGPGGFGRER
jgi:hypothetical protein